MASKVITAQLISFPGANDLVLHLSTEAAPETTLNGSGTACTLSGTDVQTCTITSSLASYGWLVAQYKRGSTVLARGMVYISGEVAGTYVVEGKDAEQRAAANYSYLPPQYRSVGDVQPLRFIWPVSGATFTGCTKEIGSDAPVSISSSSFEFLRTVDGEHVYQMTYNAADRPLTEGSVLYRLTDGTNKRKLQLYVLSLSGTNGLYSIDMTVVDDSAGVIADTIVTVKDSAQTRTLGWGRTSSSGTITFHLNAGTYKVIVQSPTGYATLPVQTLTVSTDDDVTYTLNAQDVDVGGTAAETEITIRAGVDHQTTFSVTPPSGWVKCYFAIKEKIQHEDTQSILLVVESNPGVSGDGITYLNRESYVENANGSLTVGASTVTLALNAEATLALQSDIVLHSYELKFVKSDGSVPFTMNAGKAAIKKLVSNAIT